MGKDKCYLIICVGKGLNACADDAPVSAFLLLGILGLGRN